MQTLNEGARSALFLINLNADRLISVGVLTVALTGGAFLFGF
jgi:hypothetical protein